MSEIIDADNSGHSTFITLPDAHFGKFFPKAKASVPGHQISWVSE